LTGEGVFDIVICMIWWLSIFRLPKLGLLALSLPLALGAQQDGTLRTDAFDAPDISAWQVQPDPIDKSLQVLHAPDAGLGNGCLAFQFTFDPADDGKARQSTRLLKSGSFAQVDPTKSKIVVRFKAKGSQDGRHIRLFMIDGRDECMNTAPQRVGTDWKEFEFDLTSTENKFWGRPEVVDQKLDWPLKTFGIEAVWWAGVSTESPETIWIDEIEIVEMD